MLFSWRSISHEAVAYYRMFDYLLHNKGARIDNCFKKNLTRPLLILAELP